MRGGRFTIILGGALVLAVGAAIGLRPRSKDPAAGAGLCMRASEILCGRLLACGAVARAQLSACAEHFAADCEDDVGWRIRNGARAVDAEAEEECLEGMSKAHCNQLAYLLAESEQSIFELSEACEMRELLRPAAKLGAPCLGPGDCTSGACPYAEASCHLCRPYAAIGAPCRIGFDACDPEAAFCDRDEGGSRCAPLKKDGTACAKKEECARGACRSDGVCGARPDGSPCKDGRDCARSSFCRRTGQTAGVCERRAPTGAACTADAFENACAEVEARCVNGRCLVRPFVLGGGAPCTDFADCGPNLFCRTDTTSKARACAPQRKAGERCRPLDFGACPLDMRCIHGACRVLGEEGAPCASRFECKAELDCVPGSDEGGRRCRRKSDLGETCSPEHACQRGWCDPDRGRCAPFRGRAEPCHADVECASRACAPSEGGGASVCAPPCGDIYMPLQGPMQN